jgi:tryptophan synthase alpha chain
MNPIDSMFTRLKSTGGKAFIPFLPAGDPDLGFTSRILPQVVQAGADLIEVGFPFSDPIADGPVIQASYTRALDRGVKLDGIFDALKQATSAPSWSAPLVGMVSYTLIYRRGPKLFIEQALKAGLSGAVVPDLPAEEASEFAKLASDHDFKLILLVTPTTPPARAERIVKLCTGFLYCVSIVGITGERDQLPDTLQQQLQRLREMTSLPLCVGFGVSKPAHVRQLRGIADGVIVGSAIVRRLETADSDGICKLVRELSTALHEG